MPTQLARLTIGCVGLSRKSAVDEFQLSPRTMNYTGSVLTFVTERNAVLRGYNAIKRLYAAGRTEDSRGVAIFN